MLKIRNLSYGIGRDSGPKIKVAILDTGIDMNHPLVLGEWYNAGTNEHGRIRGFKDFVQDDNPRDDSGHGTHIAGIILDLSSNTHVYVGRVVKSQKHLKSGHNTFRQRIVEVRDRHPCSPYSLLIALGFETRQN
jgi:subtilisin family serine protease